MFAFDHLFYIFREDTSVGNMFFLTSDVKKSFEMVMLAVSQKWPVLLYGPAGTGKSALIHKLAQDSRNQGMSFLFFPIVLAVGSFGLLFYLLDLFH